MWVRVTERQMNRVTLCSCTEREFIVCGSFSGISSSTVRHTEKTQWTEREKSRISHHSAVEILPTTRFTRWSHENMQLFSLNETRIRKIQKKTKANQNGFVSNEVRVCWRCWSCPQRHNRNEISHFFSVVPVSDNQRQHGLENTFTTINFGGLTLGVCLEYKYSGSKKKIEIFLSFSRLLVVTTQWRKLRMVFERF